MKPPPFKAHQQNRRTMLLILVLVFAGALSLVVLRWDRGRAPPERESAAPAREASER